MRISYYHTLSLNYALPILVELAPDDQVIATSWFVPDVTNGGRVTRAQKVNYVVHAGLDPAYVEAELGIDVAAERAGLIKTIDRLSKFAHVNEDSFGSEQEEDRKSTRLNSSH